MTTPSPLRMRVQATTGVLVGAILWWRIGGVYMIVLAATLAAMALAAWFAPGRYAKVQRWLDVFSGWVTAAVSWLLLGLVYFGLFTPLRCLGVLLRRDSLGVNRRQGARTYLRALPARAPDSFKRQY